MGITTGAAVVATVGTAAPVAGTVMGGTGVGVTRGTTGVVVVCNDALCAVSVPLGQPIAATIANSAVVEMPAAQIFEV